MKEVINTELAPKAIGPYSQGILVDGFLFASGQIPIDPATGEIVPGDIEAQTHQSMKNVKNILAAQGMDFKNVIKTTVYITNMNEFAKVNSVYSEYLTEPYPARSCVEVSKLPKGALVEVEVIAKK